MSLKTITYQDEGAMVAAQCLISMANKQELLPPQCDDDDDDGPTCVSEEENNNSINIVSSSSATGGDKMTNGYYSCDNMISSSSLPDPKQWGHENYDDSTAAQCEMVWDTKRADAAEREIDLLESIVPHDRKEAALKLFHENNYQIHGMLDKVMEQEPNHGMDWSPSTKKIFSKSISKDKNFASVSRRVKKSPGNCQAYYYSSYKRTREYAKMKRALKRQGRTTRSSSRCSMSIGECKRCSGTGELLCCDICESMYHLRCVEPKLDVVPAGNWFCEECDPKD